MLRNRGPVVKWLTHWTLNPKIRVRVSAGPDSLLTFAQTKAFASKFFVFLK